MPLRCAAAITVLAALLAAPPGSAAPAAPFHWPHGARAAVSLAYDDALDSQLDHAVPALDGARARTYTVPCGDRLAQGQDYLPAVRSSFVAIKVGGGSGVIADMAALDPYAVPVLAPVGLPGEALIALVQQAAAEGGMVNFTFHGIGGDYLSVSSAAHEALLRHLAAHRDLYWTDTFLNIMQYVKQQQP